MYNNIFDSHAHYDSKKFEKDVDTLLPHMHENGVHGIMSAASSIKSAKSAAALAAKYDFVWCSAGIHPHDAEGATPQMESELAKLAAYEKCMAIGEIGLDYHYDFSPREIQKDVFSRQMALAKELDMPVIIHDREAHADTLEIIKKHLPKGVIHCYSGSAESAAVLLNLGFYIGFTGVITFNNTRRALEVLAVIPLDRLLIETDCPYMAPVPLRGKRCDSSMLPHTAEVMAKIKNVSVQEIFDMTSKNAQDLFGIKVK